METKKIFDVPKIKARIKELEAAIRSGKRECKDKQRAFTKGLGGLNQYAYYDKHGAWLTIPCSSPKDYVYSEREEVSRLYALRAHMRGKLHIQKTKIVDDTGKVTYEEWDMKRQEAFIEEHDMDDYVLDDDDES